MCDGMVANLKPQTYRKTRNIHRIGLAANRPSADTVLVGTLYFSSDTFVLERSNGVTWDSYSPSGSSSGMTNAQVGTYVSVGI